MASCVCLEKKWDPVQAVFPVFHPMSNPHYDTILGKKTIKEMYEPKNVFVPTEPQGDLINFCELSIKIELTNL